MQRKNDVNLNLVSSHASCSQYWPSVLKQSRESFIDTIASTSVCNSTRTVTSHPPNTLSRPRTAKDYATEMSNTQKYPRLQKCSCCSIGIGERHRLWVIIVYKWGIMGDGPVFPDNFKLKWLKCLIHNCFSWGHRFQFARGTFTSFIMATMGPSERLLRPGGFWVFVLQIQKLQKIY